MLTEVYGGNTEGYGPMFAANRRLMKKLDINAVFEQRNKQMKLLNYILLKLTEIDEIGSAEELSIDWCNKNRNWAAWQKHAGHDFSIDAAINCLSRTRHRLAERQDKAGQRGLAELEEMLSAFLLHKHKVAEIAHAAPKTIML